MMPNTRITHGRGLYFDHLTRCDFCNQIVVYRANDYDDSLGVSFNIDDPVSEDWHQCLLTPAMAKRRSESAASKPQVSILQPAGSEEELERLKEEDSRRREQRDQLLCFSKEEDWKQWFEEQWWGKHPDWSKEEWEKWCQEWTQQVNQLRERRQRYFDEIIEWEEKGEEEGEEDDKENAKKYYRGIDELLLWDWNELEQIDKKHEHGQPFYDFADACAPDLEEHYRERDKRLRLLMQKRQLNWSQEKVEEWLAVKLGLLNDDGLIYDPETEYQYNHKLFGKWLDELDELRRERQEDTKR